MVFEIANMNMNIKKMDIYIDVGYHSHQHHYNHHDTKFMLTFAMMGNNYINYYLLFIYSESIDISFYC